MAKYKNVTTGDIVELEESFYEGIAHQGNYVPHVEEKKAPVKKATAKKRVKR